MRVTLTRAIVLAGIVLAVGTLGMSKVLRRQPSGALADCRGKDQLACYTQLLSERLRRDGLASAVAALDSAATTDPYVTEHAHELAHGIGIEAYGRSPDITTTFDACGDGYSSGCRHGVIQAYFESREQVAPSDVESLCQPFKGATASRWVLFQCVHGMGHGLTMFHGHNLPMALEGCDMLTDGWDRESCYGGAFMESVINATAPHHPASQLAAEGHHHSAEAFKAIDPNDPLYPCSIMAEKYLHACYQMQTSVMLNLNHGDIAAAGRSCEMAPAHMRSVCFQSLGRDITSYAVRDPQKTADLCRKASEPNRPACYFGAAKALVDWTATTDGAFTFCRLVADDAGGPACYQALGEEIATLVASVPEREEQCTRAQLPKAVATCRQGAGLR